MSGKWKVWTIVGGLLVVMALIFVFKNVTKPNDATPKQEAGIVTVEGQKITKLFESKKDGIVYIGRPTCNKCQAFQPLLEDALAENKQSILYYNTDNGKKANQENFEEIIEKTGITSVPAVLVIQNGEVTKRLDNFKDETKIQGFLAENK